MEIVSLLELYLQEQALQVEQMGRGYAWLDTGTHASMLDAGSFVRTLTQRQGLQIGSPDEVAFIQGWISEEELRERSNSFLKNEYGRHLKSLIQTN